MSEFKVGEIVVYVPGVNPHPQLIADGRPGQEAEVIQPLGSSRCRYGPMYEIRFADGAQAYCIEPELRKRRPPEQPAEEWFIEELDKLLKRDREVVA